MPDSLVCMPLARRGVRVGGSPTERAEEDLATRGYGPVNCLGAAGAGSGKLDADGGKLCQKDGRRSVALLCAGR